MPRFRPILVEVTSLKNNLYDTAYFGETFNDFSYRKFFNQ